MCFEIVNHETMIKYLYMIPLLLSCTPSLLDGYVLLDMNMIHIQGEDFFMGGAPPIAQPVHRISKLHNYWIADIEITQRTYEHIMRTNPSLKKHPSEPVSGVLWTEALTFCNTLSELQEKTPCYTNISNNDASWDISCDGYRLPTEAEWEYAAQAHMNFLYAGDTEPSRVAWFREDGLYARQGRQKPPNSWGLHDMSGNVSEWVFDGYHPYKIQPQPYTISHIHTPNRISRGGAWNDYSIDSPISNRSVDGDEWRFPWIGFRIVRTEQHSPP